MAVDRCRLTHSVVGDAATVSCPERYMSCATCSLWAVMTGWRPPAGPADHRPGGPQGLGPPSKQVGFGTSRSSGSGVSIVPRRRFVATAVAALLVVGAVLVVYDLTRSNRPSDRRCAELWNGPANQTNRSLVRRRSLPLATVRGAGPNKAGEQECAVLLRERTNGAWLLAGAELISSTSGVWGPFTSGVQYGTDSPTGGVDDSPNARLQADGSLTLSDR